MKKIITLLLIACIFITGCGKTSMKDVQQNLENAENYNNTLSILLFLAHLGHPWPIKCFDAFW